MLGMKTTKKNNIGVRLDDDTLGKLDDLCEAVGGASRSRVLRMLVLYVGHMDDAHGRELNPRHPAFVQWFRHRDEVMIKTIAEGIADALRHR